MTDPPTLPEPSDTTSGRPLVTGDGLFLLVVLLVVIAAYLPSLAGGFVFDEHHLVLDNQRLGRWEEIPLSFLRLEEESTVVSHQSGTVGRYRPLPAALGIVAWHLFKLNPLWWHVVNLALYLMTVTAVISLFRRLCPDPWVYRPAALVFALHPIHAEVVAWVALFGNTLLGLGFTLALLYHLEARTGWGMFNGLVSALFLLVALFSRETALVFPLVVFSLEWIGPGRPDETPRPSALGALWLSLPSLLTTALYLGIRWYALGGNLRMGIEGGIPWTTALLTIPGVVANYLCRLLVPVNLSPVYPVTWIGSATDPRFWGGLMALGALGFLLLHLATPTGGDARPARFGMVATFLTLLPFLHLRVLSAQLLEQDRYLFLPSIGFCFLLGQLFRTVVRPATRPAMGVALSVVVTVGLGAMSFQQSRIWRDDVTLFSRAVEMSPGSSLAHQNLGMAWLMQGRLELAEERFNHSIALGNPAAGYAGLGDVAFARGRYEAAVDAYEQALSADWNVSAALLRNLGLAYFQIGDDEQSLRTFDLLVSRFPEHPLGFFHAGLLRLSRRDHAGAIERLNTARRLDPSDFNIPYFLGEAHEALGHREEALAAYGVALALSPGFKRAQARRQALLAGHAVTPPPASAPAAPPPPTLAE